MTLTAAGTLGDPLKERNSDGETDDDLDNVLPVPGSPRQINRVYRQLTINAAGGLVEPIEDVDMGEDEVASDKPYIVQVRDS